MVLRTSFVLRIGSVIERFIVAAPNGACSAIAEGHVGECSLQSIVYGIDSIFAMSAHVNLYGLTRYVEIPIFEDFTITADKLSHVLTTHSSSEHVFEPRA